MDKLKYSAVIVGSGISGLYTALKLEQNCFGSKILLITKSTLGESNSYYAQGGMVAVLKDNNADNVELHIKDTLVAGAGLNDENTVKFISENSDRVVKDLLGFGVEFDRDESGNFKLTKEAAHSVRRILHSGGDATGREMEVALVKAVKENKNIEVRENTVIVDLLVENNICKGLISFDGNYEQINSDVVILATGGLGQIYKYTTNPACATGDGFALAYRAGAVLRDMEFVQFHPTALALDDSEHQNRFLISEAVRGEGAKLCDKNGYYYMKDYDKREELAPRDIVARANFTQMEKTNSSCVYLDATKLENPKKRFPTITKKCLQSGIDIEKDLIPVAPVAHYFMGGIKTDLNGETSVKNLFAIGEVASTGLHGANRLASNSLLECVVCAYKTAEYLKNTGQDLTPHPIPLPLGEGKVVGKFMSHTNSVAGLNLNKLKSALKTTMWQNVGIFRNADSINQALKDIEQIENEFNKSEWCANIEEYELRNMLITSKLVAKSALQRKESRGAHYRTDYLQTDAVAHHSEISK
ncbi:L-aspartate oxidase [bacterium]|nr:L-aspartate oxidase [bacterium]